MKILVICSGSLGHYYGVKQFFEYIGLNDEFNVLYAFHGFSKAIVEKDPNRYHLNSFPAFLNYEFRYTKKIKEVIQLKQHNVLLEKRVQTLGDLFEYFPPDAILLDNHAFTDGFLLKKEFSKMGFKAFFFQTRLSTELGKDSLYGTHTFNRLDWLPSWKILRRQKLHRLKYRLMMPGYSKYRQLENYKKEVDLELNNRRYRLPSLANIPELLISGTNLSHFQNPNQHYMGLCVTPKWSPVKKPDPIQILISAGSVVNKLKHFSKYKKNIQKLIQLLPDYQFVVPEGLKVENYHPNVLYYNWDQYQDRLSQSHIHITHGGINSIKDSLSYGVPTLICPLDWEGDQIHNALFFEELKLSHTWNIKKDRKEDISQKLQELTNEGYHERIQKFILKDNADYPSEKSKESFLEVIHNGKWKIRNW